MSRITDCNDLDNYTSAYLVLGKTGGDYKKDYATFKTDILNSAEISVNNANSYNSNYMTELDVTPAEMIVGWSPYSGDPAVASGDIIFRNSSLNQKYNGLWVIQTGATAAVRYSKYDTEFAIGKSLVFVRYGNFIGRSYRCITSTITVDTTAIQYERIYLPLQSLDTDSDVTFDSITLDDLTASELVAADSNKKIVSLSVATYPSLAELAYVKGLNQNLGTTSSPNFTAITTTGLGTFGTSKFGDVIGGNYSEFESDGTFKMNGNATVYMDAIVSFIYKGGAGEAVLATYIGGVRQLKFLVNDFIDINNTEAPHDYKEGTGVELHLHWTNNSAMIAGDKVQWKLECAFANIINGTNTGTIFCDPANPTVFGTKTFTVEYTAPVGGTPAGSHIYTSFGTISATDMANVKIGAGFIGTLTRIAKSAGGTDPTTGSIFAMNVGIHYQADTVGSRSQAAK
jgi:hypothetical protein